MQFHESEVLNPMLYTSLTRRFGRVIVANQGMEAVPVPMMTASGRSRTNYKHGEYYRVSCPYCGDTRSRLYFSYLWGIYDPAEQTRHLDLAHCQNESCLSKTGRRDQLSYELYDAFPSQLLRRENLRTGKPFTIPEFVDSPGRVVAVDKLSNSHPAVEYLSSRGYDVRELASQFSVGYCEDAADAYPLMQGRLVVPVFSGGKLVGWQGRYVGDIDWKARRIPKYYNWVAFSKSHFLYNQDSAVRYKLVVLVEGVTDVWSVGPQAVASFGAGASVAQLSKLGELGRDGFLVLLCDGDDAGRGPKLEAMLKHLGAYLPNRVVPVHLPNDTDPGSFHRDVLWSWIEHAVRERGWTEPINALRPLPGVQLSRRNRVLNRSD